MIFVIFTTLLGIWYPGSLRLVSSTTSCDTAFVCANDTINASTSYDCNAYKSCVNSDLIWVNGGDLRCQGGLSCEKSDELIAKTGSNLCRGAGSCINVNNMTAATGSQCDGIHCCENNEIHCGNQWLQCRGEFSCMNSDIYESSSVWMTSAHCAINSRIYNPTLINFYSYFSGYNATVICQSGNLCEIKCRGNSCFNTNLICEYGATCIINYQTNYIFLNNHEFMINDSNNNSDTGNITIIYEDSLSYVQNISNENVTLMNEYEYLPNDTLNITMGYELYLQNKEICNGFNDDSVAICSSYRGCRSYSIDFSFYNIHSLCCSGEQSCREMTINNVYNNIMYNTNNIICFANDACRLITINGAINYNNNNNNNNASSDENEQIINLYCEGRLACRDSVLNNLNRIRCAAEDACSGATIENVTTLVCTGNDACISSIIKNAYIIYAASKESIQDANITLGNFNGYVESSVYLISNAACVDTLITCQQNHTCNIICGVYESCSSLDVICYGKCNIICDENVVGKGNCPRRVNSKNPTQIPSAMPSNLPSVIPTNVPSKIPTFVPSDLPSVNPTMLNTSTTQDASLVENNSDKNREQIENEMDQLETICHWFLLVFVCFVLFLAFTGYIDASCFRYNEIFRWTRIVFCGAYALDFFTDIFFLQQLWFDLALTDSNDDHFKPLLILLTCSIIFLVVPTFFNLYQLQREVKLWFNDTDMRQIIEPWFRSYVKILYTLSIIIGGSFSAIDLCNNYLYRWPVFYMNLSKEYKQIFKNKRVFSIVILENIPQFGIQIIYSILTNQLTAITILAMIFSFLSILLTVFEFTTRKYFFETESLLVVKFEIHSIEIQNMTRTQFIEKIEHKRYAISNVIAKILSIDFSNVELLKPIPSINGAILRFHLQSDKLTKYDAMNILTDVSNSNRITLQMKQTYKLKNLPKLLKIETQTFVGAAANLSGNQMMSLSPTPMIVQQDSNGAHEHEYHTTTAVANNIEMNPSKIVSKVENSRSMDDDSQEIATINAMRTAINTPGSHLTPTKTPS